MPSQQILEISLGFMLDFNKYGIDFVEKIGTVIGIGNNFEQMVADNYEQQILGCESERAYE